MRSKYYGLKVKVTAAVLAFSLMSSVPAAAQVMITPLMGVEQTSSSSDEITGPGAASETQNTNSQSSSQGTNSQSTGTDTQTAVKPDVSAEGAVLMDASTGEVLFSKGGDTKLYPASITKVMTALLVLENLNLDDTVTFSKTATTNLESGAVSLNMTEGDQLTVRQCLYGLILKSANEIANALAEKVAGSNAGFADMMNAKAAALGCTNTHFTNPHGLNDSNHYTTAHDMALIAREAFKNADLLKINQTTAYDFPATKLEAARTITLGHKMFYKTDSRYYEGIIGGKTGYTSKAGNTLITCVERNGVRMIAVVMKCSGTHYTDTKAMLDYGFALRKGETSPKGQTQEIQQETLAAQNSDQILQQSGPGVSSYEEKWVEDSKGWYYQLSNGNHAADTWKEIGNYTYRFDTDGYMATGWRLLSGNWYYLKPSGAMAENYWLFYKENWYYLGADGIMLTNSTTPDGYYVNEDGIWKEP